MNKSIIDFLNIPSDFGNTLLIIGLILALSPYLGGLDFGVFKIPELPPPIRKRFKILGPIIFLAIFILYIPYPDIPEPEREKGNIAGEWLDLAGDTIVIIQKGKEFTGEYSNGRKLTGQFTADKKIIMDIAGEKFIGTVSEDDNNIKFNNRTWWDRSN
jgi:hypothetical protein